MIDEANMDAERSFRIERCAEDRARSSTVAKWSRKREPSRIENEEHLKKMPRTATPQGSEQNSEQATPNARVTER
jgi:hypothetical protein